MARISMVTPDVAVGDVKKVYDSTIKQWGTVSNFSQILGHSPGTLEGWSAANKGIRHANLKSDPEYVKCLQLVIIRTSTVNQSAYCLSHNVDLGREIGLSQEQIEVAQGRDFMTSPLLDERQKAAIRWAEVVTRMTAHDDESAFQTLKKHFTEKQIVELTVFCGMWNYSNRLCEALHVDLEPPEKRIKFPKD